MRVVVVGGTGNVGSAVVRALARDGDADIVGVARRLPAPDALPASEWHACDITRDDLAGVFRGADAVVHLAWEIQPSHDLERLRRTNVEGSERVARAVADAGVPALVYASSVGAYSPGPKRRRVDESWPTGGVRTSFYGRHKAAVEQMLDGFEQEQPGVRVVRLRPALIFSRRAASEIRRYFLGRLFPRALARPDAVPVVPALPRLAFQCVLSDDVAEAYRLAVRSEVRGAFNIAAEPVLDVERLARILGARPLPAPVSLARAVVAVSWRLHLQPTPEGWVDLGLRVPLMDCTRAERELGWRALRPADEVLLELLEGLRAGAGDGTPPLVPAGTG